MLEWLTLLPVWLPRPQISQVLLMEHGTWNMEYKTKKLWFYVLCYVFYEVDLLQNIR